MNVSIIGAGIPGSTTAIALEKIGIKATIFESTQTIKAVGAALVLAGNAIKAFQRYISCVSATKSPQTEESRYPYTLYFSNRDFYLESHVMQALKDA